MILLRSLRDHGLGGYHETGDRRGVLQSDPHHLRRIDDAGVQHVDILLGLCVEAEGLRLVLNPLADDDRTLHARVLRDLADWGLKRLEHDVDAGLDVGIVVADFCLLRHKTPATIVVHAASVVSTAFLAAASWLRRHGASGSIRRANSTRA